MSPSFWARLRRCFMLGLAWSVLGFLVLPLLVIVPVSLTDRPYLSLPEHGLSLRHYEAFFANPQHERTKEFLRKIL